MVNIFKYFDAVNGFSDVVVVDISGGAELSTTGCWGVFFSIS
jgi:hypothetical protein